MNKGNYSPKRYKVKINAKMAVWIESNSSSVRSPNPAEINLGILLRVFSPSSCPQHSLKVPLLKLMCPLKYVLNRENRGLPLWSSGQTFSLQIQSSGFDSRRYQIFWQAVGLERRPLSLVNTTEELLGRKSSGSGLENREYGRREPWHWPSGTFYQQMLALTSATSDSHSVGIVRSRSQAKELLNRQNFPIFPISIRIILRPYWLQTDYRWFIALSLQCPYMHERTSRDVGSTGPWLDSYQSVFLKSLIMPLPSGSSLKMSSAWL
jgi:hypothetical protein